MSTRTPTLEEWFTSYQLRKLARDHFYTPIRFRCDARALVDAWAPDEVPVTAVLVRVMALAAREVPEMNRLYLRTIFGERIVEPGHLTVNLPVILEDGGKRYLSATSIRGADALGVAEIREEIRKAKRRPLAETRVTKHVAKPNTWHARLRLRALHFAAYNFPSLIERHGGGLSVSVLLGNEAPWTAWSFGPTALTLFSTGLDTTGGGAVLDLTLGADHCALSGVQMQRAVSAIQGVLAKRAGELR